LISGGGLSKVAAVKKSETTGGDLDFEIIGSKVESKP
jgi:hypothetical protein